MKEEHKVEIRFQKKSIVTINSPITTFLCDLQASSRHIHTPNLGFIGILGNEVQSFLKISYTTKKVNNAHIMIHTRNNEIRVTHAIKVYTDLIH